MTGTNSVYDPFLLAQVRESFGRIVYTEKTHQKQASLLFSRHQITQWLLVGLTTLSSGTFIAALVGTWGAEQGSNLITSAIALVVSGISLATTTFRFAEMADMHRGVASELWNIRESYISLISDMMSGSITAEEARVIRSDLQEATRSIYAQAPRTTTRAFKQASKGLQKHEEMTFSNDEIDRFLPAALRSGMRVA